MFLNSEAVVCHKGLDSETRTEWGQKQLLIKTETTNKMDQFETRGPHEQELSKLEQNYSPALLKIRRNEAIYAVVLFCLL